MKFFKLVPVALLFEVSFGRTLLWADEFDGDSLDDTKWTRLKLAPMTYNNELQEYTDSTSNAYVKDGELHIVVVQDGQKYTSARLVTQNKAEWMYGRMEAKIKLPTGQGLWPAFWMLPSSNKFGGWPKSGEIDIVEHVSCDMNEIHGTVHTEAYNHMRNTQRGGKTMLGDVSEFHTYYVEWTDQKIDFGVDDEVYYTFENDNSDDPQRWPFSADKFHFILNIAVGGFWGGYCLDGGQLPVLDEKPELNEMVVDYVRVYGFCTPLGKDPWGSGSFEACCPDTFKCFNVWDSKALDTVETPGGKTFKCVQSEAHCKAGLIEGGCIELGKDIPEGSGMECCETSVKCNAAWDVDRPTEKFDRCVESQAHCEAQLVDGLISGSTRIFLSSIIATILFLI